MTLKDLSRELGSLDTICVGEDYAIWSLEARVVELRPSKEGWIVEEAVAGEQTIAKSTWGTEQEAVETFCALLPRAVKARLRMAGDERLCEKPAERELLLHAWR